MQTAGRLASLNISEHPPLFSGFMGAVVYVVHDGKLMSWKL